MIITLKRIGFCFLLCLSIWLAGLAWFIYEVPLSPTTNEEKTDAIVVLTGGSGRIDYGLELLAKGQSDKLFISGVHDNTTAETLIHRAPKAIQKALAGKAITIGHEAENTIGNAQETKRWLSNEKLYTIRLITTNYHMPRSLGEFQAIAGDIRIIPSPVFTDDFVLANVLKDKETRVRLFTEYHKYIASKLRHWLLKKSDA